MLLGVVEAQQLNLFSITFLSHSLNLLLVPPQFIHEIFATL
jgi:hypothetical protein